MTQASKITGFDLDVPCENCGMTVARTDDNDIDKGDGVHHTFKCVCGTDNKVESRTVFVRTPNPKSVTVAPDYNIMRRFAFQNLQSILNGSASDVIRAPQNQYKVQYNRGLREALPFIMILFELMMDQASKEETGTFLQELSDYVINADGYAIEVEDYSNEPDDEPPTKPVIRRPKNYA